MSQPSSAASIGRSILAVVTGILVGGLLSIATDALLHALGITPALGAHWSDGQLVLATVYRTLYSVAAAWLTARLAPARPMQHALILGFIAFLFSAWGAVDNWRDAYDPHWYSLAIALIAVPSAWLGGKLYISRHSRAQV